MNKLNLTVDLDVIHDVTHTTEENIYNRYVFPSQLKYMSGTMNLVLNSCFWISFIHRLCLKIICHALVKDNFQHSLLIHMIDDIQK